MGETKKNRPPDCVTETRVGNTMLTVSGYFKEGGLETAVDKMARVLKTEAVLQNMECAKENRQIDRK